MMIKPLRFLLLGLVLGTLPATVFGQPLSGKTVLNQVCAACHERQPDGGLARISQMRKTPEGWYMTVVRMGVWHGVKLSPAEERAVVRYLADTQGLAPAETKDYRWALEERINHPKGDHGELTTMCARCHSFARVALERRNADEWAKLVNMHVGQWPTIEYSAGGRDRQWFKIATTKTSTELGKLFPLDTPAWEAWQKANKPSPVGDWRVVMYRPGIGDIQGTAKISADGDNYTIDYQLKSATGQALSGSGNGILYTGYDWRGSTKLGTEDMRSVYDFAAAGESFSGRLFVAAKPEFGADVSGVRLDAKPRIMQLSPAYLKAGTSGTITISGVGLTGAVDLGAGVKIDDVVSADPQTVVVKATASADAAPGARAVKVGSVTDDGGFVVYRKLDSVRVEPPFAIARVGGNNGPVPKVDTQFAAIGYLDGPDGKAGTKDDVRVGEFPAQWSTSNTDQAAAAMEDAKFAGRIGAATGLFVPAGAGPDPARKYSTNNAGDLQVKATVDDGGHPVSGTAHLIVTVQRWISPPIR